MVVRHMVICMAIMCKLTKETKESLIIMKRKEYFKTLNTRALANEFYYFDLDNFINKNDNYEKVIKKIIRWLNSDINT